MYNPYAPRALMSPTEKEDSYAFRAIRQVSRPYKLAYATSTTQFPTAAEKVAIDKKFPGLSSGETVIAGNNAKNDPDTPFLGIFSKNPNSNCQNCISWDFECQALKIGCEIQNNDALPWILGGLAIILVVIIAK